MTPNPSDELKRFLEWAEGSTLPEGRHKDSHAYILAQAYRAMVQERDSLMDSLHASAHSVNTMRKQVSRVETKHKWLNLRVEQAEEAARELRKGVVGVKAERDQAQAACAAMRESITKILDMNPGDQWIDYKILRSSLSPKAGKEFLDRLKKAEKEIYTLEKARWERHNAEERADAAERKYMEIGKELQDAEKALSERGQRIGELEAIADEYTSEKRYRASNPNIKLKDAEDYSEVGHGVRKFFDANPQEVVDVLAENARELRAKIRELEAALKGQKEKI